MICGRRIANAGGVRVPDNHRDGLADQSGQGVSDPTGILIAVILRNAFAPGEQLPIVVGCVRIQVSRAVRSSKAISKVVCPLVLPIPCKPSEIPSVTVTGR